MAPTSYKISGWKHWCSFETESNWNQIAKEIINSRFMVNLAIHSCISYNLKSIMVRGKASKVTLWHNNSQWQLKLSLGFYKIHLLNILIILQILFEQTMVHVFKKKSASSSVITLTYPTHKIALIYWDVNVARSPWAGPNSPHPINLRPVRARPDRWAGPKTR